MIMFVGVLFQEKKEQHCIQRNLKDDRECLCILELRILDFEIVLRIEIRR